MLSVLFKALFFSFVRLVIKHSKRRTELFSVVVPIGGARGSCQLYSATALTKSKNLHKNPLNHGGVIILTQGPH